MSVGVSRGTRSAGDCVVVAALVALTAGIVPAQEVEFVAATPAHEPAARLYRSIWDEFGARIIEALETHTCLPFVEPRVPAVVADGVSHSGGPEHAMQLRATYPSELKRSTLVHELGHRHLWQLVERFDEIDGHMTLFLVLDRVWEDVWGSEFAAERVRDESAWDAGYDYATAWQWARSMSPTERSQLWTELLAINELAPACRSTPAALAGGPGAKSAAD